jgi:cytochrome c oxidase subunit 1/cytochrome c oxidase subunit I+III
MMGMPRRIYTYSDFLGLNVVNMITSVGSFVFALGVLLFVYNVWHSLRGGQRAGDNPWNAGTLEWSTSSPPPPYNFAVIPMVASRHPLWEPQLDEASGHSELQSGVVLDQGRESVATSVLDAMPDAILKMPEDTLTPFWLAAAAAAIFFGLLFHIWWLGAIGVIGSIAACVAWLRPGQEGSAA